MGEVAGRDKYLFPQHKDVRWRLEAAKIHVSIPFRSIDGSAPNKWTVAINDSIPFNRKIELLLCLSEFPFDGFYFWDPNPEFGETEDVYIGTYGNEKAIPFSNELKALLSKTGDEFTLRDYMIHHAAAE